MPARDVLVLHFAGWLVSVFLGGSRVRLPSQPEGVRPAKASLHRIGERGWIEVLVPKRTEPELWVPISLGQAERIVQQVVGAKGPGVSLIRVLLALGGQDRVGMADLLADPEFSDRNISKTLIVSLLVLTAFNADVDRRVTDISIDLGISMATTLRYLKSWVAVGILEQDPANRRYRLARRWREELASSGPSRPLSST